MERGGSTPEGSLHRVTRENIAYREYNSYVLCTLFLCTLCVLTRFSRMKVLMLRQKVGLRLKKEKKNGKKENGSKEESLL